MQKLKATRDKWENADRERQHLDDVHANSQMTIALHQSVQAQKQFNQSISKQHGHDIEDILDDVDDNREDVRAFSLRLGVDGGDPDASTDPEEVDMDEVLVALGRDNRESSRVLSTDVQRALRMQGDEDPVSGSPGIGDHYVRLPRAPVNRIQSAHMQ